VESDIFYKGDFPVTVYACYSWEMELYVGLVVSFDNIVACRPVARQRPRNKQLDNGPETATEEWCFLCGPRRDVISTTAS
jgi:hypothetical protein